MGLPVEALGLVRSEGPTPSLDDVDRRNFLGSALALAAAALLPQPVAEPARISTDDVAQCWVSDSAPYHPIPRPKSLRGRKFRPCQDGEVAPLCTNGHCTVAAYSC